MCGYGDTTATPADWPNVEVIERKKTVVERKEFPEQYIFCSVMEWIFVSAPNSYVEIINANVIIFGNRAFGRSLG